MEIKTVTITKKGQISIPKNLRETKGFAEGSKIAIITFPNHVELRPMAQLEELYPALLAESALADGWSGKEEDEAWKDL